jgi:fumarate reductase subunit D
MKCKEELLDMTFLGVVILIIFLMYILKWLQDEDMGATDILAFISSIIGVIGWITMSTH